VYNPNNFLRQDGRVQAANKTKWTNPSITVYHGTVDVHTESIRKKVDISKSDPDSDFGLGFYTTTSIVQAQIYAQKLKMESDNDVGGAVLRFTVAREQLAKLDSLWFVRSSRDADDFWNLVESCRVAGTTNRGEDQWYDLVIGPVAKWWQKRSAFPDYDQISFHTAKALEILDNGSKEVVWSC
jgi:hypothetical protein